MSASTALGLVSESLRQLLIGEWRLDLRPDVTILAPDEAATDPRINLFLYRIMESPFMRNQDWRVRPGSPERITPAPLSVNLYYLMTAYAPTDVQTGNVTAQQMLGEAMRIFFENPGVPRMYLADALHNAAEKIQLIQQPIDMNELGHVWSTFSKPFRLSVGYEVTMIQLDPSETRARAMAPRVREIGVPKVTAPFQPPEIVSLDPARARAGAALTISGKHLAGNHARIDIAGRPLPSAIPLEADVFQVTLPAGIEPGFYPIRVDVSGLCRRTFIFEALP